MSIGNVSLLSQLLAQNAYTKVDTAPARFDQDNVNNAVTFHKMLDVEFNKFAHMSPDQILQHINNSKSFTDAGVHQATTHRANVAESVIGELRKKVETHEQTIQKSLLNETSFIDLVTATNDASNTVRTLTEIRTKILESFNQILNMQI